MIINIASTPAIAGQTAVAVYSIAKSGVIAITKHIALEYGHKNIRAYTLALDDISAGAAFTYMTLAERKKAARENSMNKWRDTRELASIAASLTREEFAFVTGNMILMEGCTVML